MKKLKIIRITGKSFILKCAYCGTQIRKNRDSKTEKLNYSCSILCHKCGERSIFHSPNKGPKTNSKILCPVCKKNKMGVNSKVCKKCYLKNPSKYQKKKVVYFDGV